MQLSPTANRGGDPRPLEAAPERVCLLLFVTLMMVSTLAPFDICVSEGALLERAREAVDFSSHWRLFNVVSHFAVFFFLGLLITSIYGRSSVLLRRGGIVWAALLYRAGVGSVVPGWAACPTLGRALSPEEVERLHERLDAPHESERQRELKLLSGYDFVKAEGDTIVPAGTLGSPNLRLHRTQGDFVKVPGGGVALDQETLWMSRAPAAELTTAITASDAFTVEAWARTSV